MFLPGMVGMFFARYGWNALEQNPWKAENMYKVDARETQLKIAFYFKKIRRQSERATQT